MVFNQIQYRYVDYHGGKAIIVCRKIGSMGTNVAVAVAEDHHAEPISRHVNLHTGQQLQPQLAYTFIIHNKDIAAAAAATSAIVIIKHPESPARPLPNNVI